eukprot:gene7077-7874_t
MTDRIRTSIATGMKRKPATANHNQLKQKSKEEGLLANTAFEIIKKPSKRRDINKRKKSKCKQENEQLDDNDNKKVKNNLKTKQNNNLKSAEGKSNHTKSFLQRRVLANARERSRVHKLGKAFDNLRKVIPSYSRDQKLSKLSILRIAISYLSGLMSLLNYDQSSQAREQFAESVNECTAALQSEFGRAKLDKKIKKPK